MKELNHKCNDCQYAGEHQEMGFRPFGVCYKAPNLGEAEMAYRAKVCPYTKPLTSPRTCPFCGSRSQLVENYIGDGEVAFYVECTGCHAQTSRSVSTGSPSEKEKQEVIRKWNKRA